MGNMTRRQILAEVRRLEEKYGKEEFEKYLPDDAKWGLFVLKNKLHYLKHDKKWDKPLIPIGKNVWICTPHKNWNRHEKKYGYWQWIQTGWKLLQHEMNYKCLWCGKRLTNSKQKFCDIEFHRKSFSRIINDGKRRHGFELGKPDHILIIPRLYDYEITESGAFIEKRSKKERIEFKDIKFVINGKEYPYTKKSRTIKNNK